MEANLPSAKTSKEVEKEESMMRRYPTRDEIIQQEDDRRWPKEPTKEQPMSDTLQERESGTTTACECGRLGHSEQVRGLPKGARVKAITDIAQLGENVRIGTKGTVTGHCSDGRAIIFFDGFPHGHTFHTPNGYIDLLTDETATDYCDECKGRPHAPWCSEYRAADEISDEEYRQSANQHQPAARGGGEGELRPGMNPTCLRCFNDGWDAHRRGLHPANFHAGFATQDAPHTRNQHQSLVAEREQWERLKSKIAWHRDGIGPDVPVLQERYDRVIKERNELREERERLIVAAKAVVERLADLPRYLEKNDAQTLATMTAECLADLAVAIPAKQRSTSE